MLNISACIITNNNHKVIDAIKSVYDSVNEIILVNTCEDFTIDLTEFDKVKLYSFDWCDDFSKARNYSISKATGDWILIIDSDETLKSSIDIITDKYDFYFVKIADGTLDYDSIRIFKNRKDIRFQNKLHESVEDCCKNLKGCKTNIQFFHTISSLPQDELRKKFERNFRILLKDKRSKTKNVHFAKHYFAMQQYAEAIEYGHKVLKQKNINLENKAMISILIYSAYNLMGYGNIGIDYLRLAIQLIPMQVHARYLLVNYLYSLPDKEKHKDLILKQLVTIGSIVTFKNSDLPLDYYCDINFVNKTRKEIEKWQ